jgi:hypothetical protein
MVTSTSSIRVGAEAAEVARAEALAVIAMLHDDDRRARLAELVAALEDGEISDSDGNALAEVLELGLQTGRIRALYGPEGEQAVLALYRRLPPGRDLTQSTRDLNKALTALQGRTVERVSVNAVGPGEYGVTLSTTDFEVVIRLGKAGARLATIGA